MLLIIPAIGLKHGKCARCVCGEKGTEELYEHFVDSPSKFSTLLRRENSKSLHITDFDSFKGSDENKKMIIDVSKSVDIAINLFYDFKKEEEVHYFLDNGIYRVALSRMLVEDIEISKKLLNKYKQSKIVFAYTKNYEEFYSPEISLEEYLEKMKLIGANRIMLADKEWSSDDNKVDLDYYAELSKKFSIRFTLFDAASTSSMLWKIEKYFFKGIDSVVIDKAFYENKFPCQKIWRIAEKELEK